MYSEKFHKNKRELTICEASMFGYQETIVDLTERGLQSKTNSIWTELQESLTDRLTNFWKERSSEQNYPGTLY